MAGAVKFRLSDTVLKYGNQFVSSPVFSTDDSRLLPEVATGTLITSNEIKGLELSQAASPLEFANWHGP